LRMYTHYQRYLDNTREWREERDRLEGIYHGLVWEVGDSADARNDGETTLVDNRLRPLIRKRVSKLIANKPTGKVFGISDQDQTLIDTFAAMGDFLWDISDGHKQLTEAVMAQQKLGAGYLLLHFDPDEDYGLGELKFKYISYQNVFYDKQYTLHEAPRVIIRHLMHADVFFAEYPEHADRKAELLHPDDTVRYMMEGEDRKTISTGLPRTFEGGEKMYVLLLETYEPRKEPGFIFRDLSPDGKLISGLRGKDDGSYRDLEDFIRNALDDDDRALLDTGVALAYETRIKTVHITRTASDKVQLGEEEIHQLDYVPVIEIRGEDTHNGEPRGEIDYLHANQEFMSKALNLAISNAAMGSLLRFVADDTAAQNMTREELQSAFTEVGGMIWMHRDPTNGKFPFEAIRPEPLNEAFIYLVNYMAQTMEYGLQQHGITMGDASQAPRTASATFQIGEWAEEATVLPRSEIEKGIQSLYNLYFQWAPQVYTQYKTFSLYDADMDEEQSFAINQPAIDGERDELVILSNMSNFRARWRIHAGSTAPTRAVEKANLFKDLLQVTQNPAFLPALMEFLPLGKYKKQLSEAVDLIPQLQSQLEQLQQQNQQLQGEVDRQVQQNIEARKSQRIEKEMSEFGKERVRHEAQMELGEERLSDTISQIKSQSAQRRGDRNTE